MKQSKNKASALIVSLFILFIILIIAISVSLGASRQRIASSGSAGSIQSFGEADTGIEKVMAEIYKVENPSEISISEASFSDCQTEGVNSGFIETEKYIVEFKDDSGEKIDCSDSEANIFDIKRVKSIGRGSGEERAIEASVF
jgi:hypothetical protein